MRYGVLVMSAKLATKMVAAMKMIDAVEKNGTNTFQHYKYVRAADVANEVRKAMIANGIAFTFDVVDSKHWEGGKEGKMYFCQLTVNCTFTDSESGEQMSGRVIGWGSDTLDKAPFKAMTGAIKYAMRMNFMIPDESDPENDSKDVPQQATPYAQPAQPAPTAPRSFSKISEPQSKRFFAICKQGNKSNDEIRLYLMNTCGCEKSLDMPRDKYEAACKWAEAVPDYRPDSPEITDDDIPF